jgi:phosphatidylserine decarboxylase
MKILKEGLIFIVPFLALAILFFVFGLWIFFAIFLFITSCFCFFFRDPKRNIPKNKNLLVSPADGKIVKIQTVESHASFPSSVTSVSIFLSLFDVHISRAPLSGIVKEIERKPGQFFPAYKDEARLRNESNSIFINGDEINILIKQIVGVAARRIKCFVKKNERITRGQKIGLMYFGSRVDIFLPPEVQLKINLNQKVKAGETEIAEIK